MRLNIVCVLYNKYIIDIASLDNFLNLKKDRDVNIWLFDNSDKNYVRQNKRIYENYKIYLNYIDNGGNIGLSRTYNKALRLIQNMSDWILFSDDDTKFSMNYLINIYNEIQNNNKISIMSGVIKTKFGILSPLKDNTIFSREKGINLPGVYKNIFCINSGLVVKRSIYSIIGKYNERLFLDMIDHYFMDKLIECNYNTILIVSGEIEQDYSGEKKVYNEQIEKRYKIFKTDFVNYCSITKKSIFYKYFILNKREVKIKMLKVYSMLKK